MLVLMADEGGFDVLCAFVSCFRLGLVAGLGPYARFVCVCACVCASPSLSVLSRYYL